MVRVAPRLPKTIQDIAFTLDCPPEVHDKTLLLYTLALGQSNQARIELEASSMTNSFHSTKKS